MNSEINMSVSSLVRKGGEKAVYVLFTSGEKSAEFVLPENKLLRSKVFSQEEIIKLQEYVDADRDTIFSMAKEVNPMKAFLGKK